MANIDAKEINKFSAMAEKWWDRRGEFKALHDINPVRLSFVRMNADLSGKKVLDVGCGGGLLSEVLAASNAQVTAIDMAASALAAADAHMRQSRLAIDYRQMTVEDLAARQSACFDIVTCMELLEHVPDPKSIVTACGRLTRPGGHLFFATVNRTRLAYLLVILASEYLLRIVRKGTHRYERLVRPQELLDWGRAAGLQMHAVSGLRYIPLVGYASLCTDMRMNYLIHFIKPAPSLEIPENERKDF